MTAATKARTRGKKGPHLAQIDPRDLLAHPSNLRNGLGDLTELRASIAAVGVLQALTVVPEDDGHRIVAGHRRAKAAAEVIEAGEWPDGREHAVPCLVLPDMVGMAPEQVVAMLVENDQRADLTESERANGYAQLELFGLDVAEIARRTGRTQKHVQSALKLTQLGEKATAAADAGKLSLDDVAELAEFEGDPKAMGRILKDVGSGWGVKHKVQEERRKRTDKELVDALTAELTEAGVKILTKPKGWPYDCAMAKVDDLVTADGRKIDPEAVKTLDGYGAIIEGGYGNFRASIVCADPEVHGYKRTGHSYYKSPAQKAAEEAEQKAAEERRERLKEAAAVRRRFVVEKYGNAKTAKSMLDEAIRCAYAAPNLLSRVDGDLVQDLAGGDLGDAATAGRDRLTRLLVSRWIGAEEGQLAELASGRGWGTDKVRAVAWLDRLVGDGYELSDAEQEFRAVLVGDIEREAQEEAEEAAYDDEEEYDEEPDDEEGDDEEGDDEEGDDEEPDDEGDVPAVVDVHLPDHDVEPEGAE